LLHLFAFRTPEKIAPLRQRRDFRRRGHAAEVVSRKQHPRVARMYGEGEHPPPECGDRGRGLQSVGKWDGFVTRRGRRRWVPTRKLSDGSQTRPTLPRA